MELLLGLGAVGFIAWLFNSGSSSETSQRLFYRTAHGHEFEFDFVRQPSGEVRVYIEKSPSYGHRSTDGHSTHRYHDAGRGHFICIRNDLAPTNRADAESWARYWADQTSNYIRTGREFS